MREQFLNGTPEHERLFCAMFYRIKAAYK